LRAASDWPQDHSVFLTIDFRLPVSGLVGSELT
jgi:hypothetical protein